MKNRVQWWLLLLALLISNLYILVNRNNGYRYYPYKTYAQLYVSDSTLQIAALNFSNQTLDIVLSHFPGAAQWSLFIDNTFTKTINTSNKVITIPILVRAHRYELRPVDSNAANRIKLVVDHSPTAKGFDNEFIYANIPGPGTETLPLSRWQTPISSFTAAELRSATELINGPIGILATDNDLTKTLKIGRHLRKLRVSNNGVDVTSLNLSPLKQLELSVKQDVNINCGNYTAMFHFLGTIAGLTTRAVTFAGPQGNWHYGNHYYNEVYLHKQQQWSLIDNLNNVFLPHDTTRFYNAVDVKKMASVNGFENKFCYDLNSDTPRLVPYKANGYFHEYYNLSDADISFPTKGVQPKSGLTLLFEFYFPSADFAYYSDKKANNLFKLAAKYIFLLGLIIAVFLYLNRERLQRQEKN
ncbi:hypothetical protein EXU57_11790 [Segetibacter sp. 3557_3]|uniref:hypothetical protein n=1 Tax=Segetibacter sp. 3557_3 TaxID=2547429 RepID=UPI001058F33B|nr:hypothetical protein [Segetibacter sp. 3557_3]TDH26166.1 hypothetical protein EXU57_11790 [Segetibacter sp. 3557_3]